ncbi:MAG: hypothetical protein LBJ95_03005 [Oscillospiraceae bacterium]|jgi:hypothetical protein|nr:hypothetical protein [Oscillospiraceae bacterium]
MKWMDEKKTWRELRNMLSLCLLCWGWTIESGIICKTMRMITFIFTVLVAVRCIYLRVAPSLYQGKLDKQMNNAIVILDNPIFIVLLVLFVSDKFFGIVL